MTYPSVGLLNSEAEPATPAILGQHAPVTAQLAADRVARIGRRDESALAELQRQFRGMVLSVGRRILGDDMDAEEVVAETFWVVWIGHGFQSRIRISCCMVDDNRPQPGHRQTKILDSSTGGNEHG